MLYICLLSSFEINDIKILSPHLYVPSWFQITGLNQIGITKQNVYKRKKFNYLSMCMCTVLGQWRYREVFSKQVLFSTQLPKESPSRLVNPQ